MVPRLRPTAMRSSLPRSLAAIFAISLLLALVAGTGRSAEPARRANVILVFIDDMGWADLSCFGNREARTPNIDRLASEGIAFEQFYVNSPICSPSRVAISTGTYPQRWRITSYLAERALNDRRGMAQWLDPAAPMLARRLNRAGYATGHFGKWHMGGQRDVPEAPPISAYGFEESLTNFEGLGAKLLPLTLKPDGEAGRIWADAERLGGPVTWMQRSKITTGFVDAAIGFIRRASREGRPFYVNVWPDDVHSPFWPPVNRWGDGKKRSLYLAVLESMDRQLGRLIQHVREDPDLRDNTLILVCSDNGPEPGAGQARPFKGHKGSLYEGGIRSPLIVWGPGLVHGPAAGTRNRSSVVAAIDLAPSLVRLCDAEGSDGVAVDGEDLLDTLLGRSKRSRSQPLFFSRPPDRKNFDGWTNFPDLAVRQGSYKLLSDFDGTPRFLYDVVLDPGETRNLQRDPNYLMVERELLDLTIRWYRSMTGAPGEPAPR